MSVKSNDELFREIIRRNEVGDDPEEPFRFSDPDGERSGKSGWSFGVVQFDTQNNSQALACLKDCGFTDAEINGIVKQTIDVKPLDKRLKEHAAIIAEYDMRQLRHCIKSAMAFVADHHIPVADTAALLSLADTVNQYGSLGNGTAKTLLALQFPVTADDILAMKLTWKYAKRGQRQYDDTIRRHNNIRKVMATAALSEAA